MTINEQIELLIRGTSEVLNLEELKTKLEAGKKLKIKLGFDPTAPDLHLGHTVVLNKMRQFQDLGHEAIILVGDFTARIGDPTGKSATRPPLDEKVIKQNSKTYTDQVFKILDKKKTTVVYNNKWLGKLDATDIIRLAGCQTVARMLERDDFNKRYKSNQPIAISEFLYPLLQGFDSVELKSDVELGGTDQKFNLLMGRELQRGANLSPQVCIMMPILEGTDGVNKMSKSLDNYIGVSEDAKDQFGKIMRLSDEMMWRYYELLSFKHIAEIEDLKKRVAEGLNPKIAKVELGKEIVARFHDEAAAQKAADDFDAQFSQGQIPDDMPQFSLSAQPLPSIMKEAGLVDSTSEAMRLIKQGAVKVNGEKVSDKTYVLPVGEHVLQAGKRRFAKVEINC